MATAADPNDELKPLTSEEDGKSQDNMITINPPNPQDPDPAKPTTEPQTEAKQQQHEEDINFALSIMATASTTNASELKPLTSEQDGKSQDNMIEINVENPQDSDPPKATTVQTAAKQQQEAMTGGDVPDPQKNNKSVATATAATADQLNPLTSEEDAKNQDPDPDQAKPTTEQPTEAKQQETIIESDVKIAQKNDTSMATAAVADELNPLLVTGAEVAGAEDAKTQDLIEINLGTDQQETDTTEQETIPLIPGTEVEQKNDAEWTAKVGTGCNRGYKWFPLGVFTWIGSFLLFGCSVADMITRSTNFIEFWLYCYLIIGALLMCLIDMPISISSESEIIMKCQLGIFDWVKLFRRIWGRSTLYIAMMISCAAFMNDSNVTQFRAVPWIAGIYLLLMTLLSLIFSIIAARKYNVIREYIINSTVTNASDANEENEETRTGMLNESDIDEISLKKIIAKFDELDTDKSGKLGMAELVTLGQECGRTFSNSEKHAVFLLLDADCDGAIARAEWIMQLSKHTRLAML